MTAVFDKMQLTPVSQHSRTGVLYRSTKLYDHNEGLSCCFRQWRAEHSHCQQVHGYALAFRFVFATDRLDGLTVSHADWSFNVRPSNTEPLLRLNAEGRDEETMARVRDTLKLWSRHG